MKKDKKKLMKMLMDESPEMMEQDEMDITAKMDVLKELIDITKGSAGKNIMDDMSSLQKVTVAAPDAKSLKEGLQKAEEVVESMPEMMGDQEEDSEEKDSEEETVEPQDALMAEMDSKEEDEDEMDGLSIAEMRKRLMKKG